MEINNSNYKLLFDVPLQYNDIVVFTSKQTMRLFKYCVESSYLRCLNSPKETAVLLELCNLNLIDQDLTNGPLNEKLHRFCSEIYGYRAKYFYSQNSWPDYYKNDFKAITKLVIKIFELLEGVDIPELKLQSLSKISFL